MFKVLGLEKKNSVHLLGQLNVLKICQSLWQEHQQDRELTNGHYMLQFQHVFIYLFYFPVCPYGETKYESIYVYERQRTFQQRSAETEQHCL